MKRSKIRTALFHLAIVWLAIMSLGGFWLATLETSAPVTMAVVPQAPREGEPVIAIFNLNNPSLERAIVRYQFFANGKLLGEGAAALPPGSGKTYKYAYENPLPLGERLNFVVRTMSNLGSHEKAVSTPPYPPQVWSSFVSFASFSTSVMGSMSSMTYYQSAFGDDVGPNAGLIAAVVLIMLLIFRELSQPALATGAVVLGQLRVRFVTLVGILLIIFLGMVYTVVAMVLAG